MATASRIIKARFKVLNESPEQLDKKLPGAQRDIFPQIADLLLRLRIEGGHFVYDDNSAIIINEIEQLIRQNLQNSQYSKAVSEYLVSFDKIEELNTDLFAADKLDITSINIGRLKAIERDKVVYSLLQQNMDARFVQPVKEIINNAAIGQGNVIEARRKLRDFIVGGEGKLGFWERYVPQIAEDAINQFDGTIQTRVKEEYGLNGWSYEGSLIQDSRPQCVRWVQKKRLRDSDLASELEWARKNGSGLIPQTTSETFGIYRGGYRCRHHATAVRIKED